MENSSMEFLNWSGDVPEQFDLCNPSLVDLWNSNDDGVGSQFWNDDYSTPEVSFGKSYMRCEAHYLTEYRMSATSLRLHLSTRHSAVKNRPRVAAIRHQLTVLLRQKAMSISLNPWAGNATRCTAGEMPLLIVTRQVTNSQSVTLVLTTTAASTSSE